MHRWLMYLTISRCAAFSLFEQDNSRIYRKHLQPDWLEQTRFLPNRNKFTLPSEDDAPLTRVREIEQKRQGYLYGPSLLGNTSYFPTGFLGDAMVQQHVESWLRDAAWVNRAVEEEASAAEAAAEKGGLKHFKDYQILYEDQWQTSIPSGLVQGSLSNSTQDIWFSMERLSVNPYSIRRLHPTADPLPFEVDSITSTKLAGANIKTLQEAGRLFYVDHGYQAAYPTMAGKYSAACSAYFFLHPTFGDFLPLAIKTNVGSNLVYTPLDTQEDWFLAKAMFNMNDLFHGQIFHLANSHAVNEIVHQAALRTLSSVHPVLDLLDRLMHHAYAIRPMGEKVLFNSGGFFDQSFAITNHGVRTFATDFYSTAAGLFQSNYFHTDLVERGLINCTYGPPLSSFPFFEDASILHASIHSFMVAFIDTYYVRDDLLAQDHELQSWIQEATAEALVLDFPPSPLTHKETLVDILTQIAFLAGVSHHVLNGGEPATTSGALPLHPSAMYAPPPIKKGVKDLMSYLPPIDEAVKHIALLARFTRPQVEPRNETLLYMFSSDRFLSKCSAGIKMAASLFESEMRAFSNLVRQRNFDSEGLSQGMPFVWQALDPQRIPYFLSV